jgi:hypothetical protein
MIDYLSPAAPSEFDLELRSERTRWLRRRFLWFCLANIVLQVMATTGMAKDIRQAPPLARSLNLIETFLLIGSYAAAFFYVLRTRPALERLLHLGIYMTAILPSISEIFLRADLSLDPAGWSELFPPSLSPGAALALIGPWLILLVHLLACLFIPWTLRECLVPAAAMLAVHAVLVAGDMTLTLQGPNVVTAGVALVFSPLAVLPGLVICWWRYSRFRKRFRLVFESSGYHKLRHELEGARRVHESSLPRHDLLTGGPVCLEYAYEPMRQIGGDILFVHPADDPAAPVLSVLLIDVNGHGFGAALMANRVIGEVQRLFAENPDAAPHKVLSSLNRYVRLTMARDSVFATALCLRIDTGAGTLECANGGHPPPFLRAADGSLTRIEPDTYLLGVVDGDDYCPACRTLPFKPGDALLAYTDGATEARDLAGEMITIEGLRARLAQLPASPQRWPGDLLHQVTAHRRAPATDDTLLAVLYRT